MKTTTSISTTAVAVVLLLTSCGMQRTAQQSDDVYFIPSDAPVAAAAAPAPTPAPTPQDDYYDANTSQDYADPGGYYNVAYNDPYYYNYGRFGFGSGLAMQNGWMMNGWGRPVQWGYGTGVYSGWYGGGMNLSLGWGNWYGGGWGGWNHPGWGYSPWYNDPWYNSWGYGGAGYGGYGYGGYGYGNYYGPSGTCSCCYTPVVVGGSSGVVVAHRPSFGNNAPPLNGTPQRRASFRDPISLSNGDRRTFGSPTPRSGNGVRPTDPSRSRGTVTQRPSERQPSQRPSIDRSRSVERQAPSNRGGFDHGGAAPSRSSGGGSSGGGSNGGGGRSPGTIRHR